MSEATQTKEDSSSAKHNINDAITEEGVKKSLEAEQGTDAQLKSWTVQELSNKGDNYASIVTSVNVVYTNNEKELWTSFIVKINPCSDEASTLLTPLIFKTEATFYRDILPQLNSILSNAGQVKLKTPQCYYISLEPNKEIMYMEDMRNKGFKVINKTIGLNEAQINLVMKELARFHAASVIFKGCRTRENLEYDYPDIKERLYGGSGKVKEFIESWVNSMINSSVGILSTVEGYEEVAEEIKKFPYIETINNELHTDDTKVEALCHGDCWSNNVLFNFDKNGGVKDMCLLDFQLLRIASLATDINSILYNSIKGPIRRKNLDVFLDTYYSSYNNVLAGSNLRPLFSREELLQEYRARNLYALMITMMESPFMLISLDNADGLTSLSDYLQQPKGIAEMKKNPNFRPRFLDTLDDIIEVGILKSGPKRTSVAEKYTESLQKILDNSKAS